MIEDVVLPELDAWKGTKVKIGITGRSGAGKSTLINAIRGLTGDDEGAASVGVKETTIEPTAYPHPRNKNIEFWDLPGVGTNLFPKDQYIEKIRIEEYNIFIVVSCSRISDDDLWLADQIISLGKQFIFVRTKVDVDIQNDKKTHPKSHDSAKILEIIREDCKNQLSDRKTTFYLVDSHATEEYDFKDLISDIVENSDNRVMEALALSLGTNIRIILDLKRTALQKRVWGFSFLQLLKSQKGTEEQCEKQFEFYRAQFSLDCKSLNSLPNKEKKNILKHNLKLVKEKLFSEGNMTFLNENTFPFWGKRISAAETWASNCINELWDIALKNAAALCEVTVCHITGSDFEINCDY